MGKTKKFLNYKIYTRKNSKKDELLFPAHVFQSTVLNNKYSMDNEKHLLLEFFFKNYVSVVYRM